MASLDPSACHIAIREAEGLPPRPAPPLLEFETPPCSICGEPTEYSDTTFRCDDCGCQWPRSTAHLYAGTWDDLTADQCPDVAAVQYAEGEPEYHQCIRTAGHAGDHINPDLGEWIDDGQEG